MFTEMHFYLNEIVSHLRKCINTTGKTSFTGFCYPNVFTTRNGNYAYATTRCKNCSAPSIGITRFLSECFLCNVSCSYTSDTPTSPKK